MFKWRSSYSFIQYRYDLIQTSLSVSANNSKQTPLDTISKIRVWLLWCPGWAIRFFVRYGWNKWDTAECYKSLKFWKSNILSICHPLWCLVVTNFALLCAAWLEFALIYQMLEYIGKWLSSCCLFTLTPPNIMSNWYDDKLHQAARSLRKIECFEEPPCNFCHSQLWPGTGW